ELLGFVFCCRSVAATCSFFTPPLHDALPIWPSIGAGAVRIRSAVRRRAVRAWPVRRGSRRSRTGRCAGRSARRPPAPAPSTAPRSEEHTSELQSREKLVCRLLLEKKNSIVSV